MKQGFVATAAFALLAPLLTNAAGGQPAALPSPTPVPIASTSAVPSTSPVASALPVPSGLPVPSANPAAGSNLRATVDWSLSTAQIRDNCSAAIARAHQEQLALDALPLARATFATVVVPLEDISADLNDETIAETFLTNVSPQKDVRDASLACNTDEGTFSNEFSADPRLYALVDAARRSNTAGNVYDRKLLALWETALFRSGGALPPKQRAEFVRLSDRLTDLTNAFGNNLANDQSTIVATSGELADVPSDQVSGWTKKPDGTIVVPVNESTYALFYGNVKSEAARKRYYFAYNNRAVANVKLLREALVVRYQLAHLLGYPTWDAYQLADRMPKTPARLERFLDDLETHLRPLAAKDMAELAAVKAAQEHVSHATLEPWDTFYEQQYLLRTKYAVDENLVRQYFPVQHTIDAVLDIYSHLLGVTFTPVPDAAVWAPGVLCYDVSDTATSAYIGTFYLDLFPRPGKYDHFANFPLLPARRLADGSVRAPVAAIVGNWPQPGGSAPALLDHDDVTTFFHEFGHDMAALLATAPYETLSEGFRFDFIEAPSQMLENFTWNRQVLAKLSSNVVTGQPLPASVLDKMLAAEYFDHALDWIRQIELARIDLDYHGTDPYVDTTATWRKESLAVGVTLPPGVHPEAQFGHLMGGYDAGYYAYIWAKVYAQDMYTAFRKGGVLNPAVGHRYRETILAPARTYEPDVLVEHFLGRPMDPNTFLDEFDPAKRPLP